MKQLTCHHVYQDGTICGHKWYPRLEKPRQCPKCKSYDYDIVPAYWEKIDDNKNGKGGTEK